MTEMCNGHKLLRSHGDIPWSQQQQMGPINQYCFSFKVFFGAFYAFISRIGQLKSGQETGEREGEWHAAKGHRWNRTRVRCSEDTASVYGAPALLTEPPDAPFKGSLYCASFHSKQNTFAVVRPSFYMTTVCWRPWNFKRSKLGSRVESFKNTTFFLAV